MSTAASLTTCPDCAQLQRLPASLGEPALQCVTCHATLERGPARSIILAFAFAVATVLLLIPANFEPFLTTSALGVSRTSILASGAVTMAKDGWPLLGVVIALFVVILPFVRFGLLSVVLGQLLLGRQRPAWLGPMFHMANRLQPWAMLDVMLLALMVAYSRLQAAIAVEMDAGAYCLIAAALCGLFTRAAIDKTAIWRVIMPDETGLSGPAVIGCKGCGRLAPLSMVGQDCPRCGDRLKLRKPMSVERAAALTLAAAVLYIPANVLPLATLPIGYTPTRYTILQGVGDLFQAKLYGLGALVFTASFTIPILKLLGLSWCVASVLRRSDRHLIGKTRLYHLIDEIGRWSMVDPLVIACFVPVMQYNAVIYGRAEPAAMPFTAVVILTIIATKVFDPRLMWDAARRPA